MTLAPTETVQLPHPDNHLASSNSSQYGSLPHDPSSSLDQVHPDCFGGASTDLLDEKLRGLRRSEPTSACAATPGQRISEYENASALQAPRQGPVLRAHGIRLVDLPNEILTHVFSHLPPESHSSVALVSKRLWALVTTHHTWRVAFMRYFPGHTGSGSKEREGDAGQPDDQSPAAVRSETRYFPRLTLLATWRSEYLLRTRYLRSLARGKAGIPVGTSPRGGARSAGKKQGAVLTYNSRLPWRVTHVHAVFSPRGKKPPRAIHGTSDLGMATMGDPTTGKIEKWGVEDLYSAAQLDEVAPGLVPYGLGEGPAAGPNVMDVSQPYGMIVGEGFHGGRVYFRGVNEPRGRFLGAEIAAADARSGIPQTPQYLNSICSVWIAKSSAVTSATNSACGMLTGSALGVVTAYSLGSGTTAGPRYASGDVTARWVLSAGVPIVALRVDDGFCQARKSLGRIWAVALNALGEVYYLTETPVGKPTGAIGEPAMINAWHVGRTASWHLLERSRRVAKVDVPGNDGILEGHLGTSPKEQDPEQDELVAQVREVEKLMRSQPAWFRRAFEGWDMQRRLEVDFTSDDGQGAGESIIVVDCGLAQGRSACIRRYVRSKSRHGQLCEIQNPPLAAASSLFGLVSGAAVEALDTVESQSPRSPPPTPESPLSLARPHEWTCQTLDLKGHRHSTITALALDNSTTSQLTLAEDALCAVNAELPGVDAWGGQVSREIPGRRARFVVVGTGDGAVLAWNGRDQDRKGELQPIRIIQTDSPLVSCVAASGLYLVHGGSDGLVQAWDPLASTTEPIRTIHSRSHGRVPRHVMAMNPRFREADYWTVGAIHLDPDATLLRGVVSFGPHLRTWSYGSSGNSTAGGRKRRNHPHAEPASSRRHTGTVSGYIAAEEAELRREDEQRAREQSRLLRRFGALGDLTEEEALVYAQMVSQEEFHAGEQRRASDSMAESTADTPSSSSSTSEITPTTASNAGGDDGDDGGGDDDYEQQIQQAIRLSLMEGACEAAPAGQESPPRISTTEAGFTVKYTRAKCGRKKPSTASSTGDEDADVALAMSLSMQDQEGSSPDVGHDDSPSLPGKGKGKGVQR